MRVSELITLLQQLDPTLPVYAMCDHGQSPQKVSAPSVICAEATSYTLWDEWAFLEDNEEDGYERKAVLL